MRLKHAIDELGLKLPQLNSITLSGLDAAGRVRGANPPKTRPTPTVATDEIDAKPVWRPKRTPKAKTSKTDGVDPPILPAEQSPPEEAP